jgi:hypothetical protein
MHCLVMRVVLVADASGQRSHERNGRNESDF